jgi:hypothetical protein
VEILFSRTVENLHMIAKTRHRNVSLVAIIHIGTIIHGVPANPTQMTDNYIVRCCNLNLEVRL